MTDRPAVDPVGLRGRKKARTRSSIAGIAADLFGRYGYRAVTMVQVAQAVGVAEQTVYNYFPTKESLVFDRSDELAEMLSAVIRERSAGESIIDVLIGVLTTDGVFDAGRRAIDNDGGMPRLVASNAELHRALLVRADGAAGKLADVLRMDMRRDDVVSVTLADALVHVCVRALETLGTVTTSAELDRMIERTEAALRVLRPIEGAKI